MVFRWMLVLVLAVGLSCHLLAPYESHERRSVDGRADRGSVDRSLPDEASTCACDDELPCTEDRCDEGRCAHELLGGYCLLDERCLGDNALDPSESCRYCDAATNRWGTLNDTQRCDDGDPCTHSDACTDGVCAGIAYSCATGPPCTTGACNGVAAAPGGCALAPDTCLIDGSCVDARAGSDACHLCDPGFSAYSWSPAPGCVTTLAGDGVNDSVDGPAYAARLSEPFGVAVDAQGAILIVESEGHVVRRIAGGLVTVHAGCT